MEKIINNEKSEFRNNDMFYLFVYNYQQKEIFQK